MSVYFVHCNICGCLPQTRGQFFVANCGHISCKACVEKGMMNVCPICKKKVTLTELGHNCPEKLKKYFMDTQQLVLQLISEALKNSEQKHSREMRLQKERNALQVELKRLRSELAKKEEAARIQENLQTSLNISMTPRVKPSPRQSVNMSITQSGGDRNLKRIMNMTPILPANISTSDVNLSNHSNRSNKSNNSSGSSGLDLRYGKKKKLTLSEILSASAADKIVNEKKKSPFLSQMIPLPQVNVTNQKNEST